MRVSFVTSKHTAAIHFLSISPIFPTRIRCRDLSYFVQSNLSNRVLRFGSVMDLLQTSLPLCSSRNEWLMIIFSLRRCIENVLDLCVLYSKTSAHVVIKKNERTCLLWNLADSSKFPCLCFLFVFILQLFACFYNTHCTNQKNTRYFCVYIYLVPLSHGMYFLFWSLFSVQFHSRWCYTNAMLLKSYFRCC